MIIENEAYVGVIDRFRGTNRRGSFQFRYAITRKRSPLMLMIAGFAGTEKEATNRVEDYLHSFGENDARRTVSQNGDVTRLSIGAIGIVRR
jgi:hypothetical protein